MAKKISKNKKVNIESEKPIKRDMILFDNAPKPNKEYFLEAQALDEQIKKAGVNNIAVVAPYGAGKSSAIATYLDNYRKNGRKDPKHVQISLANFNDVKDGNKYEEEDIERSILQQLLYSEKKYKLPNSEINRTNKTHIKPMIPSFLLLIAFIFSTVVFAFEMQDNGLFDLFCINNFAIKIISLIFSILSFSALIVYLAYTGRLRKVKYKDLEVGVDKDGKTLESRSLINKFIDEVLYFFECINVDLVIFEDLDRLETMQIFVKLRELNTIINNSQKKVKKVTFVYAVKDDMFKNEEQRAKFFEFILPVIPIINPITTENYIGTMNGEMKVVMPRFKLKNQFLKDVAYFVNDMRVLKNTFNDYIIFSQKLWNDKEDKLTVNPENLFAIMLYKNLFPYDYSRLQTNDGLIPLCVDKKKAKRLCEGKIETTGNESFGELVQKIGIKEYFSAQRVAEIKTSYKEIVFDNFFKSGEGKGEIDEKNFNTQFDLQIDYLRMLIKKSYIGEDYLEYTSNYQADILSQRDRDFIRSVKKGERLSSKYKLDNVSDVIIKLNEEDFLESAVLINDIFSSLSTIKKLDKEDKVSKYSNIMTLLKSASDDVLKYTKEFMDSGEYPDKDSAIDEIANSAPVFIYELFKVGLSNVDCVLCVRKLIKYELYDILVLPEIKNYIAGYRGYFSLFEGFDVSILRELIERLDIYFEWLDINFGIDELHNFIVENGYYIVNIHNIKIVLNIDENTISDFEKRNYTYLQSRENSVLKQKINDDINTYIENVFLKLPPSEENEETVISLLGNEKLTIENKKKIIAHTDFVLSQINTVDSEFYFDLIKQNIIKPTWENIMSAYNELGFTHEFIEFVTVNCNKINGQYSEIDGNTQIGFFNDLVKNITDKEVLCCLAQKIDVKFDMTAEYAGNKSVEPFIFEGRFNYHSDDGQYLISQPNQFPYLIYHQDKIAKEMSTFYVDITFKNSFGNRILTEPQLSVEFKKEFWKCCGHVTDINGIEDPLGKFLIDHDCDFNETLLYKFTEAKSSSDLKTELLALAIRKNIITDIEKFKKYFCNICDEYSEFGQPNGVVRLKDTPANMTIKEFMIKKKLLSWHGPRNGKIVIKS